VNGSGVAGGVPRTVLIVDDSKLARMVVTRALARLRPNWRPLEAANAAEALTTLLVESIDIAFIDFNMPGADGLSLAADLRERWPTMPIAVVSANVQDEIISRARALDAAFVPKPLTDDALDAFLSGAMLRLRRVAS
jgi:CheY-like chemotaxis protein